jgi:hypothetical protein
MDTLTLKPAARSVPAEVLFVLFSLSLVVIPWFITSGLSVDLHPLFLTLAGLLLAVGGLVRLEVVSRKVTLTQTGVTIQMISGKKQQYGWDRLIGLYERRDQRTVLFFAERYLVLPIRTRELHRDLAKAIDTWARPRLAGLFSGKFESTGEVQYPVFHWNRVSALLQARRVLVWPLLAAGLGHTFMVFGGVLAIVTIADAYLLYRKLTGLPSLVVVDPRSILFRYPNRVSQYELGMLETVERTDGGEGFVLCFNDDRRLVVTLDRPFSEPLLAYLLENFPGIVKVVSP